MWRPLQFLKLLYGSGTIGRATWWTAINRQFIAKVNKTTIHKLTISKQTRRFN